MIRTILWAVDPSDHNQSTGQHALEIAGRHQAAVTALILRPTLATGPVPAGAIELNARARAELAARHDQLQHDAIESVRGRFPSVPLEVHYAQGSAAPCVMDHWRFHDLLVINPPAFFDCHGLHPGDGLQSLINLGVRPILTTPRRWRPVRRVVVSYNGSAQAAKTLKRFVQLAPFRPEQMTLVYFGTMDAESSNFLTRAQRYCRLWGFEAGIDHVPQPPQTALLPYLQSARAEMLVIGNSSHSWFTRKVLGSLAQTAIEQSDIISFLSA